MSIDWATPAGGKMFHLSQAAPALAGRGRVISFLRAMSASGIQHVIVNLPNAHELTPLELFGREIIPAVAEL